MPRGDSIAVSCARRIKVLTVSREHWNLFLRGQARILNLPADGHIVAAIPLGDQIGFRVHSARYDHVPEGQQLPVTVAVVERL